MQKRSEKEKEIENVKKEMHHKADRERHTKRER